MSNWKRRELLIGGVAATALGAAGWGARLAHEEEPGSRGVSLDASPPKARRDLNLLIIMVDQERVWDTLPDDLDMPNHRRIADAGSSFINMNCTTPLCTPSRSVIWTGQHVQHTGVYDNIEVPVFGRHLDPAIPTLGHMLSEMGFYTAYKGKWHLSGLPKDPDWGRSADRTNALEIYGYADSGWGQELIDSHDGWKFDGRIAADAATWLTQKSPTIDAPWALTVSFVNPHDIMFFDATGDQAKSRIQDVFPGPVLGLPDDPLYQTVNTEELPRNFRRPSYGGQVSSQAEYDAYMDVFYGRLPHTDLEAWLRFSNYYYNCIRDVDRHLGTVLDALEKSGQADNTIVVYLSDHGEMGGVHGLRQKGPWMYRENITVPFVVSHPDARKGRTNNGIVSTLDFAPTILGLVGADKKATKDRYTNIKGIDISEDITNASTARTRDKKGALLTYCVTHHADPNFAAAALENQIIEGPFSKVLNMAGAGFVPDMSSKSFMRGVVTDRYKFGRYFSARDHHLPKDLEELRSQNELELFDLQADPGETMNMAALAPDALLLQLNRQLNDLVDEEVGVDDGEYLPGPSWLWR
ncbi:MAG: sulfatase-like hydrolase/transferase [Pseudomonadota bacterium]